MGLPQNVAGTADDEDLAFFEKKIRPVLAERCHACHSAKAKKLKAGLYLDSRAALLKGGDTGPALVPGKPGASLLYKAVSYVDSDLAMPPKEKLPPQVIADFRTWVEKGAPWPGKSVALKAGTRTWNWEGFRSSHWAWKPPVTPGLPAVKDKAWPANGVDPFVLARLEAEGMRPSPPADRRTLIRRVFLDMIGLPPTPEQAAEFADGKKSWDQVVENLLASAHYGERWGRHWLDVARYSDGFGGFLDNKEMKNAWRYRDWVVGALNDDVKFGRFLSLQIAGDLEGKAVATGFFALGPTYRSDGGDPESNALAKAQTLEDRVDTFGRGLLGLTLACARCHDHPFDPLPTLDFYSIAGIFNNSNVGDVPLTSNKAHEAGVKKAREAEGAFNKRVAEIGKKLVDGEIRRLSAYMLAAAEFQSLKKKPDPAAFARERGLKGSLFHTCNQPFGAPKKPTPFKSLKKWESTKSEEAARAFEAAVLAMRADSAKFPEWKKLKPFIDRSFRAANPDHLAKDVSAGEAKEIADGRKRIEHLKKAIPPKPPSVHALREAGSGDMKVALRGNLRKPGPVAPRRFLRLFGGDETPKFTKGSGRSELAKAITDPANPLTARVFVNRVWGWHFGTALVNTPSNFGTFGQKPSHPKLLDWLATTFIERGGSIKDLHRTILRSATYRMSSRHDAASFAKDGSNRLLWRMSPRKLDVEAWRDSLLFVTGELKTQRGGAPYDDPATDFRRTLYAKASRNGDKFKSDRFLRLFDFPPPRASVAKRIPTITPQQSLFLLNNPFMIRRAEALAKRLEREAGTVDERIALAYQLLFARPPQPGEVEAGRRFLQGKDREGESGPPRDRRYAQALLASNEFLFVE